MILKINIAGWSSLEARRAHNPKVVGSNPAPAIFLCIFLDKIVYLRTVHRENAQIAQLVEQRTENPRVTGSIPVLGIYFFAYEYMLRTKFVICNNIPGY